ncbi:RhuM family protein [uncultured Corynebacterium sp.]|uniref:RhuM family protein n=1 Tax=uncultured Corynebacterium sp. TaxID=159447 RepID=UPI00263290D9|nr:RhuM family protein [uncultured Corynebacterium sp.]
MENVALEQGRSVRRNIEHYNLDAILAVGYRVRGPRGAQFRKWATEVLREYLIKGFALDDQRLKNDGIDLRQPRSSAPFGETYPVVLCP